MAHCARGRAVASPLLPCVFHIAGAIGAIAYQNKAKVYGMLFSAAAETLTTIAADPKHLGAEIGLTAVLPYMGTEPRPSSAYSLHRAGWWHLL